MKVYLPKMPKFVTWMYPKRIWAFSRTEPYVFLTFDDGPIPEVTPWVLEELKKFNAKASFFCIGDNVRKHPEIFEKVRSQGHAIGNHTYNHLKGSQTSAKAYMDNVKEFEEVCPVQTHLFRPPYGKITNSQAQSIRQLGYTIVMWDIVAYDWEKTISPERCLANVTRHIQPGSVIVFHDSLKAERNLRYALPKVLKLIEENGWESRAIPC